MDLVRLLLLDLPSGTTYLTSDYLRGPELSIDIFRRQLKTFLCAHEDDTVAH